MILNQCDRIMLIHYPDSFGACIARLYIAKLKFKRFIDKLIKKLWRIKY